uniref:RAB3A interacting protein (rabin3) n=1 Tax=Hucho hucho TaxID=62062 RepID=A0A4W5JKA9_9TELE
MRSICIDVLQAEVAALKTLVLSTSPTSPCHDLPGGSKTPFKKGHGRNKSTSSAMLGSGQELSVTQPIVRDCRELDSLLFSEFKLWKEEPSLKRNSSFLERVYREDIYPCLTFSKSEVHTTHTSPPGVRKCALSGQTKTCKHRIKFGDSSNYYYVSPFCRYRITSVCNFFTYIRYIHQGLVKLQDGEIT